MEEQFEDNGIFEEHRISEHEIIEENGVFKIPPSRIPDETLFNFVLKNIPTCFESFFEDEDPQEEGAHEMDVALQTYRAVYLNKFQAIRKFRNKQIAQIYGQLLSKGDECVNSPEAWLEAFMIEAMAEMRFVFGAMTYVTRETFLELMKRIGLELEDWYFLLDVLMKTRKQTRVLPNGDT